LQYLEEDLALGCTEGLESKVVEHEDLHLGETAEGGEIGAVRARLREFVEEPGDAPVRDRVAIPTRLVSERAGEIALPEARGPGEDDGLVRGRPARGAEVDEERLGEPARMAVVDVLDARREFQLGRLQARRELPVLAGDPLGVGEEAD